MNNRPMLAEIVGPSGAGKSTVSALLNSGPHNVKAGITVWGLPEISLIASGILSLPDVARLGFERRQLRIDELKQVVRLGAFHKLLKRHIDAGTKNRYDALFMDEGVVFALAKLRADIGTGFANERLKKWEQKMLDRWSGLLDAVIWLDAPDAVLIDRIRTRAKHHRMKNEHDRTIEDFLGRYRFAYEFVISELERRKDIRVLRLTTENFNTTNLAEEILKFAGCRSMPEKTGRVLTAARGMRNEQTA